MSWLCFKKQNVKAAKRAMKKVDNTKQSITVPPVAVGNATDVTMELALVAMVPALSGLFLRGYETTLAWWKLILSYLIDNNRDYLLRIQLRRQCKTFRDALPPVFPGSTFTTFPHPKYTNLKDLIDSLNNLFEKEPTKTPQYLFVQEGNHIVTPFQDDEGDECNSVSITSPISIMGEGPDKTSIQCGFDISGDRNAKVVICGLKISGATYIGIFGNRGSSVECDRCCVCDSGGCGVVMWHTTGTLCDCVVKENGLHGIWSWCHGRVEVHGDKTKVHHNCMKGNMKHFGMLSCCASSKILFRNPLTKELASINNGGGGNWGGKGSFHQVDSFDDAVESLAAAEEVGEMEEGEDDMPELEWHIDTEYDSMPELENEVEEFEELQFVLE